MADVDVLVIGAGVVGLALAQGLRKAGLRMAICEQDSDDTYYGRPRDWGITLHWGFELIAKLLPPELHSHIDEILCDPFYKQSEQDADLVTYAGHTGKVLIRTPASTARSVSRKKMRRLFSQGLEIQYAQRLVNIEISDDSATAVFEDGQRLTAKLIIGCDGSRSRVRSMLVDPETAKVKKLGINLVNFGAKFDQETALLIRKQHPIFSNSVHPSGYMYFLRILDVPDPDEAESWTFQNIFGWKGAPYASDFASKTEQTQWLKAKASEFAQPWRTVLSNIPDDTVFTIDSINTWRPVGWSASPLQGKVTLAGDAAHASTPIRGQGLNNGLEDAVQLLGRLSSAEKTDEGLRHGVQGYEEETIERGRRDVDLSESSALGMFDYNQLLNSPQAKLGLKKSQASDVEPVDSGTSTPV
ncbi:hypothetical protein LTR78_007308 [Recurvomyces mirabilis]|uniref:FAD-binding domain-containing protein n=1 Tax=Recurvomyces mirabilis TaxID=574656 RepID=A0AAE0TT58_9PEZI|nr:hypothetical protein LTR78_007308 [Recurvomyces mirabilis]KAK5155103.1 hypothetical protein LTS14_006058 [Recurvomyces mirabilis]